MSEKEIFLSYWDRKRDWKFKLFGIGFVAVCSFTLTAYVHLFKADPRSYPEVFLWSATMALYLWFQYTLRIKPK